MKIYERYGQVVNTHYPFAMNKISSYDKPQVTLLRGIKMLEGKEWWISSGTAIGLFRDGDFIPEDTDIDVGVKLDWNDDVNIKFIKGFSLVRSIFYGHRPMQLAFNDEASDKDDALYLIFDIYFYYDRGDDFLVNFCDRGEWHYPKMPIKLVDTKYGKLPFMSPVDDYLLKRYGEDWRIPKHGDKGIYSF